MLRFTSSLASLVLLLQAFELLSSATAYAAAGPRDMRGLNRLETTANLTARAIFPASTTKGFRGVNLGSWLLFEPYMAINEWTSMGGDPLCDDCTRCANDEYRLTKKIGQSKANSVFAKHWSTFITQSDVNVMVQYGINAVRIPIGFWIIENTVLSSEYYPKGGLAYLRAGCKMLNNAGISVLLDLHGAPGAQTAYQTFTGRCVSTPGFWTQSNFDRMTSAARQLTTLVHQDPTSYGSVWGIQALNEPPQDGKQTPGYLSFLKQFVKAVRDTETALKVPSNKQLSTAFMDAGWQYINNPGNPASVANGGNAYDAHVYYSFGAPCGPSGCVQNTLASHISFACSGAGGQIKSQTSLYNTPLFLGEWWLLPVSRSVFSNNEKSRVQQFGDAQKRGFSPEGGNGGYGWFFWSWKMTNSDSDGLNHMRSYKDAVAQGYLTSNAGSYFNSKICG